MEFHFAKQSIAHSLDKTPSQQQISGRFASTLAPTRRFSLKWHAKRLIQRQKTAVQTGKPTI
jgi:hypothetical protein